MSRHKKMLRGLKLESLEGRSLMAADITLTNDVLNISGSVNNDTISVTEIVASSNGWEGPTGPVTGYRATVRNGVTGQVLVTKDYGLNDFKTIVMNGDLGNDRLTNATSKPSIIMGGGGNDVAVGGSSWDIVSLDAYFSNQQAGVDTWGPGLTLRDGILTVPSHSWIAKVDIWINRNIGNGWGGDPVNELVVTYTDRNGNVGSTRFDPAQVKHIVFMGSDGAEVVRNETAVPCILYGGGGMDDLSGGSANDLIFGGEGGDILNGKLGSDKIFGGNGDDYLSGGSDTVRDELYGEMGADDFAPGVEDWTDFNNRHGDTKNRRGR